MAPSTPIARNHRTITGPKAKPMPWVAFLALLRERRLAGLRWTRFVQGCGVALAVMCGAWSAWMIAAHAAVYRAEPWRAVVGVVYVILRFLFYMATKKRTKMRRELDDLEREIAASRDAG
jgi:hypothetical protein